MSQPSCFYFEFTYAAAQYIFLLSNTMQCHISGIQIEPTVSSRPINNSNCLICLDKAVDTVLYRCGHMCVCITCGMNLQQRGSHCPVCRAPIQDIIRAYKCN